MHRLQRGFAPPPISITDAVNHFAQHGGPGGRPPSLSGPLVLRDAGDAVAGQISGLLDKEARGVLGDVPGGTIVLNAVEGAVGDILRPGFSGGVSALEAAYIAAGATPVEQAARARDVEGTTGSKQLYDPSAAGGYRTVGGSGRLGQTIRGVPPGFEEDALDG